MTQSCSAMFKTSDRVNKPSHKVILVQIFEFFLNFSKLWSGLVVFVPTLHHDVVDTIGAVLCVQEEGGG